MCKADMDDIANDPDFIHVYVYALVHGGCAVRAGWSNPFECPWDSGRSGLVFIERSNVQKGESDEEVQGRLIKAVNRFSAALCGDAYRYTVYKGEEAIVSLGRYLDKDECYKEMADVMDELYEGNAELAATAQTSENGGQ
jgi:hypothetical protein